MAFGSEISVQDKVGAEPRAKWGESLAAGFQILPDAVFRGQHLLRLTATDMVVIANLNQAWWFNDRRPFLQPATIAKRMGVSERSVQRSLARLRKKELLRLVKTKMPDGTIRYAHDLTGLKVVLEKLAQRDIQYSQELRANREGATNHAM